MNAVRRATLPTTLVIALLAGALAAQTPTPAAPQTPQERLATLKAASSLHREGLRPWHLVMSFQLFDLEGKPQEKGTLEEWWVAPGRERLVIDSPSYHRTMPSPERDTAGDPRSGYLINLLLKQAIDPIPGYKPGDQILLKEQSRKFGKVSLSCLTVSTVRYPDSTTPAFCTEPAKPVLRISFDNADMTLTRNMLATFQNTSLARDNNISFGAKSAINGHVDTLEVFNPTTSTLTFTEAHREDTIPGVVLAGKVLRKVAPVYPAEARQQRIAGSVLLHAVISKEGRVSDLHVITSPHLLLTEAAIDAVKKWEYSAYLINGVPTEVDTTITVNFNIGY